MNMKSILIGTESFFNIVRNYYVDIGIGDWKPIPIEMHTSYMTDETSFPFYDCYRVVYHAKYL